MKSSRSTLKPKPSLHALQWLGLAMIGLGILGFCFAENADNPKSPKMYESSEAFKAIQPTQTFNPAPSKLVKQNQDQITEVKLNKELVLIDQVAFEMAQYNLDFQTLEDQHRQTMAQYSANQLWPFVQSAIDTRLDAQERLASFYLLRLASEKNVEHFKKIVNDSYANENNPLDAHSAESLSQTFEINMRTLSLAEIEAQILSQPDTSLSDLNPQNKYLKKIVGLLQVSKDLQRPLISELLSHPQQNQNL